MLREFPAKDRTLPKGARNAQQIAIGAEQQRWGFAMITE
jgi:hypothetical protein